MIVRVVKLQFHPEKLPDFLDHFETIKNKVNGFPGCFGMQLLVDNNKDGTILTYSHWISDVALENYRHSETFGSFWPHIKKWFAKPAEAWTLDLYFDGFEKFR